MKKKIPLEDTFADILSKAIRGTGRKPEEIAAEAGVASQVTDGVLNGFFDERAVRSMAGVLGLNADRLVSIGQNEYEPEEVEPMPGLVCFNTVFEDMTVNSYLIWDEATKEAAAIDTGTDCTDLLASLERHGLTLKLILLTHSHGDHIFELDRLVEKTGAEAWTPQDEPVEGAKPFEIGREFQLGSLKIETRLTKGHSAGAATYVVRGLSRTLAFVGDALFAGSMGGPAVSYQDAIATAQKEIFSLSDTTVLCPGHGPLTTVAEQRKANPFFPEQTSAADS